MITKDDLANVIYGDVDKSISNVFALIEAEREQYAE
jgi:hypothetical protein